MFRCRVSAPWGCPRLVGFKAAASDWSPWRIARDASARRVGWTSITRRLLEGPEAGARQRAIALASRTVADPVAGRVAQDALRDDQPPISQGRSMRSCTR